MGKLAKESRRLIAQFANLVRYGKLNPYPRTQRKAKPKILRAQPDWEIRSSLEFVASHVARQQEDFVFVQIGAFDGNFDDPIFQLVRKHGWRGLLVEPQPQAFELLRRNYADQPQLMFENAAVSHGDGTITMYTLKDSPSPLASFDRRHLVRHAQRPGDIVAHEVPCFTLPTLLRRHHLDHVDLLQIDTEGFDAEIVRMIDFREFQPAIIRYEHANLLHQDRCECIQLLAAHQYRILLEDSDTIAYREGRRAVA